jgi:hypothetical protein
MVIETSRPIANFARDLGISDRSVRTGWSNQRDQHLVHGELPIDERED